MHLNSELLFKKYALPYFKPNLRVLEIGPAGFPSAYQKLVHIDNIEWHTIDFSNTTYIDTATNNLTHTLTSPYEFPIEDEVYDIVLSGQVIEHVEKIWTWLTELRRITKFNGYIITINPVSWPYHEAPIDCWRIFPNGIYALAEQTNLYVEKCVCESLEKDNILKIDRDATFIPGQSYNYISNLQQTNRQIRFNKILRKFPMLKDFEKPIEISYDTLSVLKKNEKLD